eukprot:CAMPEP_0168760030 /NCGR_PEP_ID=MMETSP0724-20121128/22541_1 /TAXON_ID=265536 /ORGANISM="Amphiprora sp., Strain CCMP467" /LENGTH=316 /DNA_ID=CAMNT_0008808997 /DNA_START=101 /DNA_END=1051 /DNA_ORIENTATION=+
MSTAEGDSKSSSEQKQMENKQQEEHDQVTIDKPLSKNQMKKRKKLERMVEMRKRKKQQKKDAKIAKAQAAGRDLDREREELEARTARGEGRRKRQAIWDSKMKQASASFQVSIDCSFEEHMTSKEVGSLALQLRYCYASNRRSSKPCYYTATSLAGATLKHLQNVCGFPESWLAKGFAHTEVSLEEHFKSQLTNLVYLTSDSDNVIEVLENNKIYVIGGIVDRNRLQRAALDRAEALGLATAKLPLGKHLEEMESTHVLTCNHVFDILLMYRELEGSAETSRPPWRQALEAVLPSRKGAKFAQREKPKDNNGNEAG